MVTESDTNEIVPIIKLVPLVINAAEQNVNNNTGTSAHVCDVNSSTDTTTIATSTLITDISLASCSADASPIEVDT